MVLLISFAFSAEPIPNLGIEDKKIAELNKIQLQACLSDFKADQWQNLAPSLSSLKNILDQNYINLRSELKYRTVEFRDAQGLKKRLRLGQSKNKKSIWEYSLTLEKLDDKNIGSHLEIPKEHQINPSQIIVSGYLLNSTILSDEKLIVDTKLNEVKVTARYLSEELQGLEWAQGKKSLKLVCELKALQALCLCKK